MDTTGTGRFRDDRVASEMPRVTFRSRRRRKRPRSSACAETTTHNDELVVPSKRNDNKADNSQSERERVTESELQMEDTTRSLPMLLDSRATGRWRQGCSRWQVRALRGGDSGTARWRPYAKRSIRYSQLCTAPSEAVLALERNGSYFVSLGGGGGGGDEKSPLLALRIYGEDNMCLNYDRCSFIKC